MSKRPNGKGKEEYASDGDSAGMPPSKKNAKKGAEDSDDIVVCEISKSRRVTVRNWQGKVMVDIREFYVKDGKQLPGKKGISLNVDQWTVLRDHVDDISKAVENA